MQLARLKADITRQNVVENNILDKVVPVVLFVIILLNTGKRNSDNARVLRSRLVGTLHKHRVIGLDMNTKRLIGISVADKHLVRIPQLNGEEVVSPAHSGKIAARDDGSVFVNNADNSVDCVLHLMDDSLK